MKNGTMQVDERVMTAVSSRLKNSCESGQNRHGRAKDSDGTLGGAGDVTGQIDQ